MELFLLTAHMIGDYIFQTDKQAKNKLKDKKALLIHCFTYTLAFSPLLFFGLNPWALLFIFVTHVIIDHKRWIKDPPWPPKVILVDQTLHLIVLCLVMAVN